MRASETLCIGEQMIARAESALGFALPPVLNGLYRHVANGSFGPEYLLLPLTGNGRTAVAGPTDWADAAVRIGAKG